MKSSAVSTVFAAALLLDAQLQPIGPDEIQGKVTAYTPPARANTIRAQVNLIEVPVSVRDGKRTVAGLERGDFEVSDSGHVREIQSFSVQTTNRADAQAPASTSENGSGASAASDSAKGKRRYIALLFDNTNIDDPELVLVKKAAQKFAQESLGPEDRVAVVTTAAPKSSAMFTSDAGDAVQQIEMLRAQPRVIDDSSLNTACPSMNSYEAYLLANQLDSELLTIKSQEYRDCTGTGSESSRGAGASGARSSKSRSGTGGSGGVNSSQISESIQAKAKAIWQQTKLNSENTLRVIRGLVQGMANLPGDKTVVLTSSGFLTGELETGLDDVTHRALASGVVINGLEARGLVAYTPGGDITRSTLYRSPRTAAQAQLRDLRTQSTELQAPDDGMAALAIGSGGRFFHDDNDLARGYRELAAAPDVIYFLRISSDARDGRYHALKVRLMNGHHGSVNARPGYMAPPTAPSVPGASERPIDREFLDFGTIADLPATIEASPWAAGIGAVKVTAHVDFSKLNFDFDQLQGRRIQHLVFVAALVDANGAFLSGKQWKVDLALKEPTYNSFSGKTFNLTLGLDALPGKYTARGVVVEGLTGKMTAATQTLEITSPQK